MSTIALQPAAGPALSAVEGLQNALHAALTNRRRWLLAAQTAQDAGLFVITHAFRFNAAQETEHANVLQGLLRTCGGDPLPLAPDTASLPDDPLHLLQFAAQAEQRQADLLPEYALAARTAGLSRIAGALDRIAETELLHARRFSQYADALSVGTLFRDRRRTSWFCLRCGHLHYGTAAPDACSACQSGGGAFIRTSFYPFAVRG